MNGPPCPWSPEDTLHDSASPSLDPVGDTLMKTTGGSPQTQTSTHLDSAQCSETESAGSSPSPRSRSSVMGSGTSEPQTFVEVYISPSWPSLSSIVSPESVVPSSPWMARLLLPAGAAPSAMGSSSSSSSSGSSSSSRSASSSPRPSPLVQEVPAASSSSGSSPAPSSPMPSQSSSSAPSSPMLESAVPSPPWMARLLLRPPATPDDYSSP